MGLFGPGPDMMASIGLDPRAWIIGTRQIETSLTVLHRRILATSALAGVGIAGFAVNSAMKFEDAFTGVAKTVDATDEQLAGLRQGFRDLAQEIPVTAVELAAIGQVAGEMAIAPDKIIAFTRVMADLGVAATNISAPDAARSLAGIANVMGTSEDDFDRMASTLVELGNNFETTEAQTLAFASRLAGTGKLVGMSEADIFGLSAAMTSLLIRPEMGGTATSRILREMFTSIKDDSAAAQKRLSLFAEVAGTDAEAFARAWEKDPVGALVAFIEGLNQMSEDGGNTIGVLRELGLSNVRVSEVALKAAGAGNQTRKAVDMANKAWEENTALTEEASRRYATTSSQLKLLRNAVNDVAITFGDRMLPGIVSAAQGLRDFVRNGSTDLGSLGGAAIAMKDSIVRAVGTIVSRFREGLGDNGVAGIAVIVAIALGGLGVAFGLLTPIVGDLAFAAGTVVGWFSALGTWLDSIPGAVEALSFGIGIATLAFAAWTAVQALAIPVAFAVTSGFWATAGALWGVIAPLLVAAAPFVLIAALAVGAYLAFKNWGEISEWFADVFSKMNARLDFELKAMGAGFKVLFGWLAGVVVWWDATFGNTPASVWAKMGAGIDAAVGFVADLGPRIVALLTEGFAAVKSLVTGALGWFGSFVDGVFAAVAAAPVAHLEAFLTFIDSAGTRLLGLFTEGFAAVKGVWDSFASDLKERIAGIVTTVTTFLSGLGASALAFAGDVGTKMLQGLKDGWASVSTWASGLGASLWASVGDLAAEGKTRGLAILTGLKDGAVDGWSATSAWFGALPATIAAKVGDLGAKGNAWGVSILTDLKTGLTDTWGEVSEWLATLPTKVAAGVGDLVGAAWNIGYNAIKGLLKGVTDTWGEITTWVGNATDGLVQSWKDRLGIKSPSKVFEDIGKNVSAGFDIGVKDFGNGLSERPVAVTMNVAGGGRGGPLVGHLHLHGVRTRAEGEAAADGFARKVRGLGVIG